MKKLFKRLFMRRSAFIVLSTMTLSLSAYGQISVDSVLVHLASNQRPVHNVIVGNSSDNPAYVTVQVEEFPNPDIPEQVIPSLDLIASPKAFSIEPNGSRTVRLLLKTPPTDKERVFRVSFVPQDRGFGQEIEQTVAGRSTVIRVLTGMGLLVFADPINPHTKLSWERIGDKVIFKNSGNVNAYLNDGQACLKSPDGETPGEGCAKLDSKRVYGGTTYEVKAPSGSTVTFLKRDATRGDFERLTIPPVMK